MASSSLITRIGIAAALAALVAACGGGGGETGTCQNASAQTCATKQ